MYTVFIEGLEFYGYHGVPAEERVIGHRFSIDLYLTVRGSAQASDQIGDTADYGQVGQAVIEMLASQKAHTLEHLAASVCDHLLDRYSIIDEVRIRMSKPNPPTPIIAARAGVEMSRARA